MTTQSVFRVASLALVLVGCTGDVRDTHRENRPGAARNEASLLPPREASAAVSRLLYERNLISDPEVNRKMNEAVLRITKGKAPPDSVMPLFHRWLEHWAAAHPAQVEAARLAGGAYTPEVRRMYADTDSSRKVQTDSIRRLIRERAKQRMEAALRPVRRD